MSVRKSLHVALLASALVSACGSDKTDEASNPAADAGAGADAAVPPHMGEPDGGKDDPEPSDGKPDAGGGPVATGCDAIALEKTADSVQYELPLHVPAAEEREYCQLVMLKEDLNLNWSDGRYTIGSHHALVHRTSYSGEMPTKTIDGTAVDFDPTQPHPCLTPTALWDSLGVVAAGRRVDHVKDETPSAKGVLPSDVAYKLKKGEIILLNFHMVNSTDSDVDSCFKVNLHGIPAKQVKQEAGTVFFYNIGIAVPANGTATARMACPVTKDVNLRTGVSHMHSRGDGYWAKLLDKSPADPTNKLVTELYTGKVWEDPVDRVYKEPIKLKTGQWIDYECHYTNHEDRDVAQGFASTDEMCMFIGAYWPRDYAFETCATTANDQNPHVGQGGSNGITFGSGKKSGAEFLGCFWERSAAARAAERPLSFTGAGDDPERLKDIQCLTNTCPEASLSQRAYMTCVGDNAPYCAAQCKDTETSSLQALCATDSAAHGGCSDAYGHDGSDGTCAKPDPVTHKGPGDLAYEACTTPAKLSAFTNDCATTKCTESCSSGRDSAPCKACMGTFTGQAGDTSCMNIAIGSCVQAQATAIVTECVNGCFTECITVKETACNLDCLNHVECAAEYATVGSATCKAPAK